MLRKVKRIRATTIAEFIRLAQNEGLPADGRPFYVARFNKMDVMEDSCGLIILECRKYGKNTFTGASLSPTGYSYLMVEGRAAKDLKKLQVTTNWHVAFTFHRKEKYQLFGHNVTAVYPSGVVCITSDIGVKQPSGVSNKKTVSTQMEEQPSGVSNKKTVSTQTEEQPSGVSNKKTVSTQTEEKPSGVSNKKTVSTQAEEQLRNNTVDKSVGDDDAMSLNKTSSIFHSEMGTNTLTETGIQEAGESVENISSLENERSKSTTTADNGRVIEQQHDDTDAIIKSKAVMRKNDVATYEVGSGENLVGRVQESGIFVPLSDTIDATDQLGLEFIHGWQNLNLANTIDTVATTEQQTEAVSNAMEQKDLVGSSIISKQANEDSASFDSDPNESVAFEILAAKDQSFMAQDTSEDEYDAPVQTYQPEKMGPTISSLSGSSGTVYSQDLQLLADRSAMMEVEEAATFCEKKL